LNAQAGELFQLQVADQPRPQRAELLPEITTADTWVSIEPIHGRSHYPRVCV
jgi:hypothetical protein